MEVYVDDMLVKTLYIENNLTCMKEMFNVLHTKNMKLNPNKCMFEVSSEKFLKLYGELARYRTQIKLGQS